MVEVTSFDRLDTETVFTHISDAFIAALKYAKGPEAVAQFLDMVAAGEITTDVICQVSRRALREVVEPDMKANAIRSIRVFEECQAAREPIPINSGTSSKQGNTESQTQGERLPAA
jgi:hypothetical protein